MKSITLLCIVSVCLFIIGCSDDGPTDPKDKKGKLVVKSIPPGARIFLMGNDTGKNTPDSLVDLNPGVYDLFLLLQYYDTAFFSANVVENLTTTKEIILSDALPSVNITLNYTISYGGDSVKFNYTLNQDVLLDSIIIKRPVSTVRDTTEKNTFNSQLFSYEDQSGNPITYYLPTTGSGRNFYPRIEDTNYFIDFYGRKVHGSGTLFHLSFSQEL